MNTFSGKIYYITRTWVKYTDSKSCSHIREYYSNLLLKYGDVCVVTPNYKTKERINIENLISFPYSNNYISKINTLLQYALIKEDYLDSWTMATYNFMKNIVNENDMIFSVTGGDLASVKLASMLKRQKKCKVVINFSDPIDGIIIKGLKSDIYKGFDRSRIAYNYMKDADAFITSSKTYLEELNNDIRYNKIIKFNHYYGIANDQLCENNINNLKPHEPLNIVYAGTMGKIQGAEIGYKAFKNVSGVNLFYLCSNYKHKQKSMPANNVYFMPLLNKNEYNSYLSKNCDIGFVSLTSPFAGVYVPSKLFDYLNLGIPILASLPDGDAKNIINNNGYGFASDDGDVDTLRSNLNKLLDKSVYNSIKDRIVSDRFKWSRKQSDIDFYEIMNRIFDKVFV